MIYSVALVLGYSKVIQLYIYLDLYAKGPKVCVCLYIYILFIIGCYKTLNVDIQDIEYIPCAIQ